MFNCKVCPERADRINDLKAEIAFLRVYVNPPGDPHSIHQVHLEADGILSGQSHTIDNDTPQMSPKELEDIERERERILSATY